jgi:hypothetical protein
MAHGVAQIHAALVTALTGLTTTGARVYDDESTVIAEANLPALRVLDDGNESIEYATQRPPRTLLRTVPFTVFIKCKAANAKATLNTSLAEIEAALYANRTLGGLARDVRLEEVDKNTSDDLETRVGEAVLRVVVEWHCLEGSPQTPL